MSESAVSERMKHLQEIVASLYSSVRDLEILAPGRKFTMDGHMVGSIGELWATYAYDLQLLPNSTPVHDAVAPGGRLVQIKTTQRKAVSSYDGQPDHLVVLRLLPDGSIEECFNGPGEIAWQFVGPVSKNGQRRISVTRLQEAMSSVPTSSRIDRV